MSGMMWKVLSVGRDKSNPRKAWKPQFESEYLTQQAAITECDRLNATTPGVAFFVDGPEGEHYE